MLKVHVVLSIFDVFEKECLRKDIKGASGIEAAHFPLYSVKLSWQGMLNGRAWMMIGRA